MGERLAYDRSRFPAADPVARGGSPMLDRCVDAVLDVLLVAVAVLAALALAPEPEPRTTRSTAGPDPALLHAAIDRLSVAVPQATGVYDRAQFPHWLEITAGCDARCVVLDRQRSPGGWLSAYDGYVA